jgi:hypothetical protein
LAEFSLVEFSQFRSNQTHDAGSVMRRSMHTMFAGGTERSQPRGLLADGRGLTLCKAKRRLA